jgi:Fur family transcriptional regulator, ferric uptake regulator
MLYFENEYQNHFIHMVKFSGQKFHQLLKERGLNSTRQRDEIVRVLVESGAHLSAAELYHRLRQQNPRIGYATVYRTLRLLAESGWVSPRQFGDRIFRFERRTAGEHHDHFICLMCGKIIEFESERIEVLQSRIARRQGFQIYDHKLELYGHCSVCAARKGAPRRIPNKNGQKKIH